MSKCSGVLTSKPIESFFETSNLSIVSDSNCLVITKKTVLFNSNFPNCNFQFKFIFWSSSWIVQSFGKFQIEIQSLYCKVLFQTFNQTIFVELIEELSWVITNERRELKSIFPKLSKNLKQCIRASYFEVLRALSAPIRKNARSAARPNSGPERAQQQSNRVHRVLHSALLGFIRSLRSSGEQSGELLHQSCSLSSLLIQNLWNLENWPNLTIALPWMLVTLPNPSSLFTKLCLDPNFEFTKSSLLFTESSTGTTIFIITTLHSEYYFLNTTFYIVESAWWTSTVACCPSFPMHLQLHARMLATSLYKPQGKMQWSICKDTFTFSVLISRFSFPVLNIVTTCC